MIERPQFTYILRRRNESENCQAQVVVIQSQRRLTPAQVLENLKNTTHYPAHEFEEVYQEPNTSIVLDTWEPAIEHLKPADMDWPAVRTFSNWWDEDAPLETAVY